MRHQVGAILGASVLLCTTLACSSSTGHVDVSVQIEPIGEQMSGEDVTVEFATTKSLGSLSPDEFLDGVDAQVGTTDDNGCVSVRVSTATDQATIGDPIIGVLFDELWVMRVSSETATETIVIETPGSGNAETVVPSYTGESESFSVVAYVLYGLIPYLDAQVCGGGGS